jgi:hypothetical protein
MNNSQIILKVFISSVFSLYPPANIITLSFNLSFSKKIDFT